MKSFFLPLTEPLGLIWLFIKKQGLAVEPVACDFRAYGTPKPAFSIVPSWGNFELWALYTHERIGWLVYKLRGWI